MIEGAPTIPFGNEGLDRILRGGLPADRLYLLEGAPGSGKTTLGLQFLREGVRRGEKALYVTLSEPGRSSPSPPPPTAGASTSSRYSNSARPTRCWATRASNRFFIRGKWS